MTKTKLVHNRLVEETEFGWQGICSCGYWTGYHPAGTVHQRIQKHLDNCAEG